MWRLFQWGVVLGVVIVVNVVLVVLKGRLYYCNVRIYNNARLCGSWTKWLNCFRCWKGTGEMDDQEGEETPDRVVEGGRVTGSGRRGWNVAKNYANNADEVEQNGEVVDIRKNYVVLFLFTIKATTTTIMMVCMIIQMIM